MPSPPIELTTSVDGPPIPAVSANDLAVAEFISGEDAALQSCHTTLSGLVAWIAAVRANINAGTPTPAFTITAPGPVKATPLPAIPKLSTLPTALIP